MSAATRSAHDSQVQSSTFYPVATGLGWFSVGLGVAEVLAPRAIANLIGLRNGTHPHTLLRSLLFGPREIVAGVGILTQPNPAGWLWGRVAGDVLDISSLAAALRSRENDRKRLIGALLAVLGVSLADYVAAQQLTEFSSDRVSGRSGISTAASSFVTRSVWVNKPPEEAYRFWRNFENLPRFMHHLESVQKVGESRSRWRVKGPLGRSFEWEARIERDEPNQLIAWRSIEGSEVENSGKVSFEFGPAGRGTIVRVDVTYQPPGGRVGAGVAKLMGRDAGQMLATDLRAFKQIIETGEVIKSDASVHRGMHAAQPTPITAHSTQQYH